jgi:two-component system sensor histidine kinase/response regulator
MDDYLSKPIDRVKLDACLDRLLPSTGSTGLTFAIQEAPNVFENAPPRASVQPHHPVDWTAFLESIDGDEVFARDLADAFIGTGDRELAVIAAALGTGDAATVRESAHSLKGASANLRASAATSAAAQLESAARLGKSAEIPALAEKLTTEIRRTMAYLRSSAG